MDGKKCGNYFKSVSNYCFAQKVYTKNVKEHIVALLKN